MQRFLLTKKMQKQNLIFFMQMQNANFNCKKNLIIQG